MVAELDMNVLDVTKIADMIDDEISSLVPEWKPSPWIVREMPRLTNTGFRHNWISNHTSTGSLMEFLSHNHGSKNLNMQCSGCASMHGWFDHSDHQETEDGPTGSRSQLDYQEIWDRLESRELSSVSSDICCTHTDEECEKLDQPVIPSKADAELVLEKEVESLSKDCSAIQVTGPGSEFQSAVKSGD